MSAYRGVLLDVEGTTTPITFVTEVLFPFARERLREACGRADPRIEEAVALLEEEHAAEAPPEVPEFGDGSAYASYLMDRDRKSTGLKALQGVIWEEGYAGGELKAPVFPDVPQALRVWHASGKQIHIYSSGSVLAQKLLFAHTDHGDLTPYLDGYHDTRVGGKREAESYRKIQRAMNVRAEETLFLSDVVEELDAAREAGMGTGLVRRPGNPEVAAGGHPVWTDFLGGLGAT